MGAADGLGGKLIRTVSFLGCTFPVSFLGGTAPVGILGMFSAITLFAKTKVDAEECQTLSRQSGRALCRRGPQLQAFSSINSRRAPLSMISGVVSRQNTAVTMNTACGLPLSSSQPNTSGVMMPPMLKPL